MRKREYHFHNLDNGSVDYIETEISSTHQHGIRDGRQKKQNRTPESMRLANIRERQKKIRHTLIANFRPQDYYMTLTWKREKRPETLEEGKKVVQEFLKKLRKEFKRRGSKLKYIGTLERGERGGLHFHCVINRIQDLDSIIDSLWSENGRPNIRFLYKEGRYEDLAKYLGKEQEERWHTRSRNMDKPDVRTTTIKEPKDLLTEVPTVKKGYQIVHDTIVSGINPYTGRAYLKYAQEKIEKARKAEIYIVVSPKPAKKRFSWSYVLEFKSKVRKKSGTCSTCNAAFVSALAAAVSRINDKKAEIRINADSQWLSGQIKQLPSIADADFRRPDGCPIEYQEEWISIWLAIQKKKIQVNTGEHQYSAILRRKNGEELHE